jgi:hypothetical protein
MLPWGKQRSRSRCEEDREEPFGVWASHFAHRCRKAAAIRKLWETRFDLHRTRLDARPSDSTHKIFIATDPRPARKAEGQFNLTGDHGLAIRALGFLAHQMGGGTRG